MTVYGARVEPLDITDDAAAFGARNALAALNVGSIRAQFEVNALGP